MEKRYAKRMEGLTGNVIRDIFKLIDMPEIISFAGGNPSPGTFPVEDVKNICAEILERDGKKILQYGATEGYYPLRETVAGMMGKIGISCTADNVLITTGGMQGIDLVCKAFLDEGDAVLVESPTFLGALHTFKLYRPRIISVPMDEEGMVMGALEEKLKLYKPKFIYTVPTFQNPTGKTLGLMRRKQMLRLAKKYDTLILEDDPYRDLRYFGEPVAPIASLDEGLENIVYLMSFSKILSPGLRVGAAIAEPSLHRKLTICKQGVDVHTSLLAQAIANEYVRDGYLKKNLPASLACYREQLSAMLDGFAGFPVGIKHTRPEGGLFVWVELPQDMDATELLKKAVKEGVAFIPGANFFADEGHKNTMRLNFSMSGVPAIKKGMGILAGVLRDGSY